MQTHIHIAVRLPIIPGPHSSAHPCPDTQACPLLPPPPLLTSCHARIGHGREAMGSQGGQVKGRGQCRGRCDSPIKTPVPVPSLALCAMHTLPYPTSSSTLMACNLGLGHDGQPGGQELSEVSRVRAGLSSKHNTNKDSPLF